MSPRRAAAVGRRRSRTATAPSARCGGQDTQASNHRLMSVPA